MPKRTHACPISREQFRAKGRPVKVVIDGKEQEGLPPVYPTLAEQLLAVVEYTGVQATDEIRRLVADLERAVLRS